MMPRKFLIAVILLYAILWAFTAVRMAPTPSSFTFGGDASGYHAGAVSLLTDGTYSLQGRPYVDREPGQSLFLAGVYSISGTGNRFAVFFVQGLLYLAAAFLFCRELARHTSARIGVLCLLLLLTLPSAFHVIFSLNRELLALSLFLLLAASFLRLTQSPSWRPAIFGGLAFGGLILTYIPLVLFPFFVLPLFWFHRIPKKYMIAFFGVPLLCTALWMARNYRIEGQLCLAGCYRANQQWAVRGMQAEHLRGFEPFRCLWSEYISRDWTGRSPYCSFNAVQHRLWPEGLHLDARDDAIGAEGKQRIRAHFLNYLWFSFTDMIELHLPYAGSWGRLYNVLTTLGSAVLYLGTLLSLPLIFRHKSFLFLFAALLYVTALFSLTDATPRYLLPVIFVYAAFAAIGYNRLLSRILWLR